VFCRSEMFSTARVWFTAQESLQFGLRGRQ
jgi:hypothetical protein